MYKNTRRQCLLDMHLGKFLPVNIRHVQVLLTSVDVRKFLNNLSSSAEETIRNPIRDVGWQNDHANQVEFSSSHISDNRPTEVYIYILKPT